jgi:uncharacterized protein
LTDAVGVAESARMVFAEPPPGAAWQHRDARLGFEVAFFRADAGGLCVEGHTTAVEEGEVWWVQYVIALDAGWRARGARVIGRSRLGSHERTIETDGAGRWRVDGVPAPHLDGCYDLDLESSALTNACPVRRLGLAVGAAADAPAAYVRALDLRVERLEQRYRRIADDGSHQRFDYAAPGFGFECVITYDPHGLALDYPGIASRVV